MFDFLRRIILTEEQLLECTDVLKKYCRVELTTKQMRKILALHKDAQKDIRYFGASDTAERGRLADFVSTTVGAGHWPCNGENRFEEFWKDFSEKATAYGYSVLQW